jgi:hypothetical protein
VLKGFEPAHIFITRRVCIPTFLFNNYNNIAVLNNKPVNQYSIKEQEQIGVPSMYSTA